MSSTVECDIHGAQSRSFVCAHIADTLRTGTAVGFHWSSSDESPHPDAWCTSCDEARILAGGDWTPDVEESLNVKLLCGICYERAKSIWERLSRGSPELETLDQLLGGDMRLNVIRTIWPDDRRFLVGIKALVLARDVLLLAHDGVEVSQWRFRRLFDEGSVLSELDRFSLHLTHQGSGKIA